jgi:hypothetical protein
VESIALRPTVAHLPRAGLRPPDVSNGRFPSS